MTMILIVNFLGGSFVTYCLLNTAEFGTCLATYRRLSKIRDPPSWR